MCILMEKYFQLKKKLEMCQYDTDAPAQGPSSPHAGILQKMKLKKGHNNNWRILP